jgi:hypothetical protein
MTKLLQLKMMNGDKIRVKRIVVTATNLMHKFHSKIIKKLNLSKKEEKYKENRESRNIFLKIKKVKTHLILFRMKIL